MIFKIQIWAAARNIMLQLTLRSGYVTVQYAVAEEIVNAENADVMNKVIASLSLGNFVTRYELK